jgi:hypothetical protein
MPQPSNLARKKKRPRIPRAVTRLLAQRMSSASQGLARDGEAVAIASGVEAGTAATPDFDIASNPVMLIEANIVVGFRENA